MPTKVRIRFVSPKEARNVTAKIRAEVVRRIAQATIDRAVIRTDGHPSVTRMRVTKVNQWSADLSGVPGPGIIRPVRASALRFDPGGGFIFRQHTKYVGLEPLLQAEARRIQEPELDLESIDPT